MAKNKSGGGKAGAKIPKRIAGVKIPKGLRDSGDAAVKLAQSPMARELLSAGLAAAAAALAANSRARKAAQQSGAEATDAFAQAAGTARESASKIGAAFVEAAGAAAQRLFTTVAAAETAMPGRGKQAETPSESRPDAPPVEPDLAAAAAPVPEKKPRANGASKPARPRTAKVRPGTSGTTTA